MRPLAGAGHRLPLRLRGMVAVSTALAALVLLGFVGLAIDASRVELVQAELQNAADGCALAAVLELNGLADGPSRAALAGQFVGGNRNRRVDYRLFSRAACRAAAAGSAGWKRDG